MAMILAWFCLAVTLKGKRFAGHIARKVPSIVLQVADLLASIPAGAATRRDGQRGRYRGKRAKEPRRSPLQSLAADSRRPH
jgi:hypothetical protein